MKCSAILGVSVMAVLGLTVNLASAQHRTSHARNIYIKFPEDKGSSMSHQTGNGNGQHQLPSNLYSHDNNGAASNPHQQARTK